MFVRADSRGGGGVSYWQGKRRMCLRLPLARSLHAWDVCCEGLSYGHSEQRSNKQHILATKNMSIKPLADRVLIRPAAQEEKTVSGIIIPDSAKEKPLRGEVIAVGGGTKEEEMVLKAGDVVLYGKYAGTEIEHEGEKYLIMRQSDVLATI